MAYRTQASETIVLILKTPFLMFLGILASLAVVPLMIIHTVRTYTEPRKRNT